LSVREIRLFGDPILKSVCDKVSDPSKVKDLVQDLLDTASQPGRAGVAANQIGVSLAVFSYFVNGKAGYLVNPEILELSGDEVELEEGCLSLPGLWHKTPRFQKAVVRGQLLDGTTVEITGEGLLAQVLQHECDHLQGIVYIEKLSPEERKVALRSLREQPWFRR
jgi:peptide deformylase